MQATVPPMPSLRHGFLSAALLGASQAAHAQHVSLWAGGGLGTFVTGGAGIDDANGHRMLIGAVDLPGDRVALRALKGTLERSKHIPTNSGDDDLDYTGFDVVLRGRASGLKMDLALGVVRYEETYHLGYPHQDLGGREFVHRWGPQLSLMRSRPVWRFGQLWMAGTLGYAPYQPRQLLLFLDAGVGLRAP